MVAGAEQAGRPAVVQISEHCVKYYGALEPIALALARAATTETRGEARPPLTG
jgi:fructose-bisphosphate aldolase, class II